MVAVQRVKEGQDQLEALDTVNKQLQEDSTHLKDVIDELRSLHFDLSKLDFTCSEHRRLRRVLFPKAHFSVSSGLRTSGRECEVEITGYHAFSQELCI